jgi:CTP synthase
MPSHPWFVAVQFHPEFQSKPLKPHPLFASFVEAAYQHKSGKLEHVGVPESQVRVG